MPVFFINPVYWSMVIGEWAVERFGMMNDE